eukprot:366429-Chlamydomonas_euryale.AAC.9
MEEWGNVTAPAATLVQLLVQPGPIPPPQPRQLQRLSAHAVATASLRAVARLAQECLHTHPAGFPAADAAGLRRRSAAASGALAASCRSAAVAVCKVPVVAASDDRAGRRAPPREPPRKPRDRTLGAAAMRRRPARAAAQRLLRASARSRSLKARRLCGALDRGALCHNELCRAGPRGHARCRNGAALGRSQALHKAQQRAAAVALRV